MKHSNPVQYNVRFLKESFSEKPIVKNNFNTNENYCEKHAIADYYCETK